jgi:RimJ/RimL family protein N-acetyltransferase
VAVSSLAGMDIRDESLVLRPWRQDDVPALVQACRDPEIQRWTLVPDGYTEQLGREFVAYTDQAREAGTSVELAVTGAGDGELLGSVGLVDIALDHERADIGYWTAPHARGRGVASGAVRLLSGWAFDTLPVTRLQLMPFAANEASQRVAERAGYEREGMLRRFYRAQTGMVDIVMYSQVRGGVA